MVSLYAKPLDRAYGITLGNQNTPNFAFILGWGYLYLYQN